MKAKLPLAPFAVVKLVRELRSKTTDRRPLVLGGARSLVEALRRELVRDGEPSAVHVGSTDGEANPVRIPFCARQLFGGLRRTTSAGMVPARELVSLDDVRARRSAAVRP